MRWPRASVSIAGSPPPWEPGGAVCGVSGAIAIGGAVGAKKQDISVAISLVVVWAIVMIFVLPARSAGTRPLHRRRGRLDRHIGVCRCRGSCRRADLRRLRGQCRRDIAGHAGCRGHGVHAHEGHRPRHLDRRMGLRAVVSSRRRAGSAPASKAASGAGEIWRRFPKFVLGFLLASLLVTWFASGYDYARVQEGVLPGLVAPLQALRTWAFTFAFLSIGLTTRVREFVAVGARPFLAFTAGAAVNVLLGFVPVDASVRRLLERPRAMSLARPAHTAHSTPRRHRGGVAGAVELELGLCRGARGGRPLCAARALRRGVERLRHAFAASTSTRQS